jgi:hypothetical protein
MEQYNGCWIGLGLRYDDDAQGEFLVVWAAPSGWVMCDVLVDVGLRFKKVASLDRF